MKRNSNVWCDAGMAEKRPLIVIVGPTASGKTALAVALCRRIGGEVVTADSMQVYRGMDIGTAKPDTDEQGGVPHHMIDVVSPDEEYSVHRFSGEAEQCIRAIHERGRIPVMSGGTGLYVDAVVYGLGFTDAGTDPSFRRELWRQSRTEGPDSLHRRLVAVDPDSAAAIHPNNVKRVIRALEVYHLTGTPFSRYTNKRRVRWSPYHCFGLSMARDALYERINRRVDDMMARGLLKEVARLRDSCPGWSDTARQGLGYKELLDYLEERFTLSEAVEILKRRTRNYAKRQMTWFRRMPGVTWLDASQPVEKLVDSICDAMRDDA